MSAEWRSGKVSAHQSVKLAYSFAIAERRFDVQCSTFLYTGGCTVTSFSLRGYAGVRGLL